MGRALRRRALSPVREGTSRRFGGGGAPSEPPRPAETIMLSEDRKLVLHGVAVT